MVRSSQCFYYTVINGKKTKRACVFFFAFFQRIGFPCGAKGRGAKHGAEGLAKGTSCPIHHF